MQQIPDLLQEMKIKLGAWLPGLRNKEGSAVWKIEMEYRTVVFELPISWNDYSPPSASVSPSFKRVHSFSLLPVCKKLKNKVSSRNL
jgi:hypothetical protein